MLKMCIPSPEVPSWIPDNNLRGGREGGRYPAKGRAEQRGIPCSSSPRRRGSRPTGKAYEADGHRNYPASETKVVCPLFSPAPWLTMMQAYTTVFASLGPCFTRSCARGKTNNQIFFGRA